MVKCILYQIKHVKLFFFLLQDHDYLYEIEVRLAQKEGCV